MGTLPPGSTQSNPSLIRSHRVANWRCPSRFFKRTPAGQTGAAEIREPEAYLAAWAASGGEAAVRGQEFAAE